MSDELWYYAIDGKQMEPVPLEALRQLAAARKLNERDMVWREGMPQWVRAADISELGFAPLPQLPTAPYATPYATPYAAPHADAAGGVLNYYGDAQALNSPMAGFWLRFGAYIIDYIITQVAAAIAGGALGFIIGLLMASSGNSGSSIQIVAQSTGSVVGLVIAWLYGALMESSEKQATLGKMACGIIVTDERGQRISFGRATGRHFGKILSGLILCIGFMMAGWTEKKQALHDQLAGTLVKQKRA